MKVFALWLKRWSFIAWDLVYLSWLLLVVVSFVLIPPLGFLLLVGTVAFIAAAYLLSRKEKFFSHRRTGEITTYVKNANEEEKDPGELLFFLGDLEDHYLNDPDHPDYNPKKEDWEILVVPRKKGMIDNRTLLNKWANIYGVGIYPIVKTLVYDFAWNKWDQPRGSTELVMVPRHEMVISIFWKFPYGLLIEKAETRDQIEVDVYLMVGTEIVNPKRALFDTKPAGEWLLRVLAFVEAEMRDLVGRTSYQDIIEQDLDPSMTTVLENVNKNKQGDKTVWHYGAKFTEIKVRKIQKRVSAEVEKSITAKIVAKNNADARKEEAAGEAEYITKTADATAKGIEKRYAAAAAHPGGIQALAWETSTGNLATAPNLQVLGSGVMPMVSLTPPKDAAPTSTPAPAPTAGP
jgi:hypothetical protein